MVSIFVYGAGGHGKVVVDTVANGQISYGIRHFVDDDPRLQGGTLLGHAVQGPEAIADDWGFVAIGDNATRARIAARYSGRLVSLVHRSAVLGRGVVPGEGSIVMAGAIVNVGSTIGAGVIINTAATVDHDCVIGDNVHIAPGSHLCGNVQVGEGSLLGVGTLVVPGIHIGRNAFIHAGQTITRDVFDGEIVRTFRSRSTSRVPEPSTLSSHPS